MSQKHLYYNYDWTRVPETLYPRIVREFLDNGAERFVFTSALLQRALTEPDFSAFLKGLEKKFHVKFGAMHALYGGENCLDSPDPALRSGMLERMIRSLRIASEFEVKTMTVHADAADYVLRRCPVEVTRPFFRESLAELLKYAKKYGVVIAVENCYEKPNTAGEIAYLVEPFAGDPCLGFCYDTGHAGVMTPAPWKDMAMYEKEYDAPDFWPVAREWWEGLELEDGSFERMRDNIVTCHIHDNNGYNDLHGMPFDGVIDWNGMMKKLNSCPRMIEYQTEVCFDCGVNWAGPLLAPAGGYSIRRLVETFRRLGF